MTPTNWATQPGPTLFIGYKRIILYTYLRWKYCEHILSDKVATTKLRVRFITSFRFPSLYIYVNLRIVSKGKILKFIPCRVVHICWNRWCLYILYLHGVISLELLNNFKFYLIEDIDWDIKAFWGSFTQQLTEMTDLEWLHMISILCQWKLVITDRF